MKLTIYFALAVCGWWARAARTQRLGPQLFTADRNITQLVRMPRRGHGGALLRCMVTYLRLLSALITRVSRRLVYARRAARYLFKHNGPKFLRVKMTEEALVEAFRWSNVELRHFRFLKAETSGEFELFVKCYRTNLVWFL